jgi:hypothetical protein
MKFNQIVPQHPTHPFEVSIVAHGSVVGSNSNLSEYLNLENNEN